MKLDWRILAAFFTIFLITRGEAQKLTEPASKVVLGVDKVNDAKSLRDLIQATIPKLNEPERIKSPELSTIKESLLKSPASPGLSVNLTAILKETAKTEDLKVSLGMSLEAAAAIADPNINIIDSHISQFVNTSVLSERFKPDDEEIKRLAEEHHQGSHVLNIFRENLQVDTINEEVGFKIGRSVEQWKTLMMSIDKTALIGKTSSGIILAVGYNETYEQKATIQFEVETGSKLLIETLKVWDNNQNRGRNLLLVAINKQLIWHEFTENEIFEIQRWSLLKEIDALVHFSHDGSEILLLSTIDDRGKVQAELIEFNVPEREFWVLQVFPLQTRCPSMAPLDLGRDFVLAFVQENSVQIYRHQFTKHLRGKFSLFKTIEAANVSTISGFRIGGHSYLAIGGDEPQILRYNAIGEFRPQTILSKSFGTVEEYLPMPIRTYRDDFLLLVQHRINMDTHSIAVVDALVWNGITFESVLSIPCNISADPNANGFTCMLDLERDDGLLGATFVHQEKERRLYLIMPRYEDHSGLFRVKYSIIDADDPLMKEMEQLKKTIELINNMMEYEEAAKKDIDEALKVVNAKDDFSFANLQPIELIKTDALVLLDSSVRLNSDVIEFIGSNWTQADFLIDLDRLEAFIAGDEQKLKSIDEELNTLNRIHRQVDDRQGHKPDSPIHNIGAYNFNGKLSSPQTITLLPEDRTRQPRQNDAPVHNLGTYNFSGQLSPQIIGIQPQDRRRPPRQVVPIDESQIKSLTVIDLEVDTINGIPVDDFLFLENGQLIIPDKDVIFADSMQIENLNMLNDGKVNGLRFQRDVLAVQSPNQVNQLAFDTISVQNLISKALNNVPVDVDSLNRVQMIEVEKLTADDIVMNGDLEVETINGMNWNEFSTKLVPKHLPSDIDELVVKGDVIVVGEQSRLNAATINGLPFPEGYVLKQGPDQSIITGRKTFTDELSVDAIDTDGTIDGIEPSNIITLDQVQRIQGDTTFRQLEVVRKLEVNGTISGKALDAFLPNPTLKEVREVSAACNFNELIVEGTVTIENQLNNQNLEEILSDVVYETQDGSEVVIKGAKVFKNLEIQGDLEVASNFLNDHKLDNFMMTDRDQEVNLGVLEGNIFFTNLSLSGLFDGINATELERNSVRTYGDQFIETPIILDPRFHAGANEADIKTHLNGIPTADFIFIDGGPVNLTSIQEVFFENLEVDNFHLDGDLTGPGFIANLNISEIVMYALSKTRKQTILAPVEVESLTTNGTFFGRTINGRNFDEFINHMRSIRNFKEIILSGEHIINNMYVDGDVEVKSVNDRDFNELIKSVIWLNRPNVIESHVNFIDDVTIEGPLVVEGSVNRKPFKTFVDNWISKFEPKIVVESDKTFTRDVIVEDACTVELLNGIRFEDLLMSTTDKLDVGHFNVLGKVNVESLNIDMLLNGKPAKRLHEIYFYDAVNNTHIVKTDVNFKGHVAIDYLETPLLNHLNVSKWMSNMIRKDESGVRVTSEKIFQNTFNADQGLYVDSVIVGGNEIKMDFLDSVIVIHDPSIKVINSDLCFSNDVYPTYVGINEDLHTRFINGCDIYDWLHYSLPINRNLDLNGTLEIASSALHSEYFTADFINGIPISSLITTKTDQTFDYAKIQDLHVQEPLIVHEKSFEVERDNTLMKNEKLQIVDVLTKIPSIRVLGPLTIQGKINSKNVSDAVSLLDSSPTIRSGVRLRSVQADSLIAENHINGVNFDKWHENVLWARGRDDQTVSGEWRVKKLRLTEDATGNGLINGLSISDIERNLKNNIVAIETTVANHTNKYYEMCSTLSFKANQSQNSIHILKHFELEFKIQESEEIFSYFAFTSALQEHFFAVNTNCTTQLYKWVRDTERFQKLYQIVTGLVHDWEVTTKGSEVFVITNSRLDSGGSSCLVSGVHVWKIEEDLKLIHINKIANQSEVLQLHTSPYQPGRFYTLDNDDQVSYFDVFGEKKEFWNLPHEHFNYSFMSAEVGREVALYNGRSVFLLHSKFKSRPARFTWDTEAPRMSIQRLKPPQTGDSRMFMMRPDASLNRQSSLPLIPGMPIDGSQKDIVTKMRQVGDTVRYSISDSFKKIPKVTVKQVDPDVQSPNKDKIHWITRKTTVAPSSTETPTTKRTSTFKIKQPKKANQETDNETIGAENVTKPDTIADKLRKIGESMSAAFALLKDSKKAAKEAKEAQLEAKLTQESSTDEIPSPTSTEAFSSSATTAETFSEVSSTEVRPSQTSVESVSEASSTEFRPPPTSVESVSEASSTEFRPPPTSVESVFEASSTENSLSASTTKAATEPSTTKETLSASTEPTLMKSSAIPSAPSEFPTTTTQEPATSKLEITTFANENVEPAKDLNQLAIPLVPRVVLPQDEEEDEEAAADDDLDRPKLFPDTLHFSLPENLNKKIAQLSEFNLAQEQVPFEVIQGSGVSVTENSVIPERGNGEFITLYVGHHSRKEMRYAITKKRDSVIRGPNDSNIDILYDNYLGYQYIRCTDPSNLVALHFRDETLLAFLEGQSEIQVYTYRGMEGFVNFRRIKLPGYAQRMTSLILPPKVNYKCNRHYLVVQMETEILFYGVKIDGNCGLKAVHCDGL